jgi:hypothetical protein
MERFSIMQSLSESSETQRGSLDGTGSGDHDQAYRFGFKPRAIHTYPFSTRQYVRLLVLRGRVQDGLLGSDDQAAA